MIQESELKDFLNKYKLLTDLSWKRGHEALLATETGFGECTGYEKVIFEEESITVFCHDCCYDLWEESSYSLSFEEILMSEEEWSTHLEELRKITQMKKELKVEQERIERLKEKEEQFQRLKQELGK